MACGILLFPFLRIFHLRAYEQPDERPYGHEREEIIVVLMVVVPEYSAYCTLEFMIGERTHKRRNGATL
jgi:hypothetical protein